jgi:site-specific recombinase XerC
MTALRKRFIEDLQLQGMSPRTQQAYVRAVRMFAQHDGKSPDRITEEELRQYFLSVKNIKKWSRATITQALCGLKFFYEQTLHREWTTLDVIRPPHEQRLPVILTLEEVQRILPTVRLLRYQACLTTIYACGLRLTEGTPLQVADIDSARMLVHVRLGKGGKACPEPVEGTGMCLCRNARWHCSGSTGKPIATRSGCFPPPDAAASMKAMPPNRRPLPMCRQPSGPLSKRPASPRRHPSTPCAIPLPRTCSKRA